MAFGYTKLLLDQSLITIQFSRNKRNIHNVQKSARIQTSLNAISHIMPIDIFITTPAACSAVNKKKEHTIHNSDHSDHNENEKADEMAWMGSLLISRR